MLQPDLESHLRETASPRGTVWRDVLADLETPVAAYWKLAHDERDSFLLESVTGGEQVGRYSFLGVRPRATLRAKGRILERDGRTRELEAGEDPLHALAAEVADRSDRPEGFPAFVGGAVGMLAYDVVRHFERLPGGPEDDLGLPDMAMGLYDVFLVFDHAKNRLRVVASAERTEAAYRAAEAEIARVLSRLAEPLPPLPSGSFPVEQPVSNVTQARFEEMVERMKGYIAQGDGVQMVPAQRFRVRCDAHPLTVYRALRSINPSPYMFLLRQEGFDVVGASPELLTSLYGEEARVRPIAGTRWRGKDLAEDDRLAAELIADPKERAEHIMLVDLGRNDLGRVCETGTVRVKELMVIERYSHVMHIVSDVRGTLKTGLSAFDLVRAVFPAGTVSGAPKIRAMEIIDELEPTRRGLYAGAVGTFSRSGEADLCIALRTILLKDGFGYVQAGGGVVHDSVPALEFQESCNKARASLLALEMAQKGL